MKVPKQLPVPECEGDSWYDRIRCAWDECENPGSRLHVRVICNARGVYRHDQRPRDKCYSCETRAYCCAQHGDYDARSHIPGQYGRLSPGANPRTFAVR